MAWVATEDQRLNYQLLNQKALRADSYKNVQEATEERMRRWEGKMGYIRMITRDLPLEGRF